MVGSEPEHDPPAFPLNPPLFTLAHNHMPSPERPGTLTPPLHSAASVPFRWEESPGKPKACTAITAVPIPGDFSQRCLELPPRLLMDAKFTNQRSPTTVLDGPYTGRSKYQLQSSSFRMVGSECYGSFRSGNCSPETAPFGALVVSRKGLRAKEKGKGFLGSWKRRALKGKREVGGGSYVFPSSGDRESDCICGTEGEKVGSTSVKITRFTRAGSFSVVSNAKSHFWASVCEGLKQVVPWRSKKAKKGF